MSTNADQTDDGMQSPASPGSRLERTARATFGRHLDQDEQVLAALDAFAAETGTTVAFAATVGALSGALAWTLIRGSGLLPWLVLGALCGIAAGTAVSASRVRRPAGPGGLIIKLVLTDRRLISFRRGAAFRVKPLRSFPLQEVAGFEVLPTRLGNYRRLLVELVNRPEIALVAWPGNAVAHLTSRFEAGALPETPASEDDATG